MMWVGGSWRTKRTPPRSSAARWPRLRAIARMTCRSSPDCRPPPCGDRRPRRALQDRCRLVVRDASCRQDLSTEPGSMRWARTSLRTCEPGSYEAFAMPEVGTLTPDTRRITGALPLTPVAPRNPSGRLSRVFGSMCRGGNTVRLTIRHGARHGEPRASSTDLALAAGVSLAADCLPGLEFDVGPPSAAERADEAPACVRA